MFHYFEDIKKYTDQLFYTWGIIDIGEPLDVYDKFERKIPLDWPLCVSPDITQALPKLRITLKKSKKQFLSTFYLIKKAYHAKNKNQTFILSLISNTQKDLISLFKSKICKRNILMTKKYLT